MYYELNEFMWKKIMNRKEKKIAPISGFAYH